MQIGQAGIDLIKSFEGCRLTAYLCPAGIWTIGYGHTGTGVKKRLTITKSEAERLLRQDLQKFEKNVEKFSNYNWNQNEFDAMVSFAYNVGSINQLTANGKRTKAQIAAAMLQYNKAAGRVLPGLTRRRKAERDLFLKPVVQEVEEVVEVKKLKVIVNEKEQQVDGVFFEGMNYVSIRQLAKLLGCEVTNQGSTPVLKK